ncbi:unnamed protein product [Protopolystoma xenopodis]|uniref:Uncharacterized protein n=1 Tax=Protopolystoma xenopodis TaxID=117903 RepID=A0A3S5BCU6_9PLAT|nr:unnamed protein product [Protopolystoma xenopodis]
MGLFWSEFVARRCLLDPQTSRCTRIEWAEINHTNCNSPAAGRTHEGHAKPREIVRLWKVDAAGSGGIMQMKEHTSLFSPNWRMMGPTALHESLKVCPHRLMPELPTARQQTRLSVCSQLETPVRCIDFMAMCDEFVSHSASFLIYSRLCVCALMPEYSKLQSDLKIAGSGILPKELFDLSNMALGMKGCCPTYEGKGQNACLGSYECGLYVKYGGGKQLARELV